MNPYPRDFRNGVFKYTSTAGGAKPLRDDLRRTLRQGIPGTAMPSFCKLPDHEIDALIEYVEYLSIRGQTELYLFQTVVDEDALLPLSLPEVIAEGVRPAAKSWDDARLLAVVPPKPPPVDTSERLAASIARGGELFHGTGSQCVKCHGPLGDSNGEQAELYDDWNLRKKGPRRSRPGRWPGGSGCPSSCCVRATSHWGSSMAATGRSTNIGGSAWASRVRRCRRPAPPRAAKAS